MLVLNECAMFTPRGSFIGIGAYFPTMLNTQGSHCCHLDLTGSGRGYLSGLSGQFVV